MWELDKSPSSPSRTAAWHWRSKNRKLSRALNSIIITYNALILRDQTTMFGNYVYHILCCWESIHFSCPPTKTARRSQQPQQIPFTVLTLSAEAAACRASSGSHTASSTSAKATATWWFSAPTQTTRPSREAPSSGCHCTNLPGRSRKGQSEVERSNTSPGFRGHFAGDGTYELRLEGIVIDISGLRWCDKYKVIVFLVENDEVWW